MYSFPISILNERQLLRTVTISSIMKIHMYKQCDEIMLIPETGIENT